MAKYGKGASKNVESAMRRKSRKQAIAIGLSEAREKGAKVPRKGTGGSRKRTGGSKKKAAKKR
jgi:hypothetical protein